METTEPKTIETTTKEPIIKARNLNFTYNKGKDNEFHALININMEIYQEEFIIFFGPSGCGKSTLLNVVAGLEIPDEGSEVTALGRDMMKLTGKQFADYHRHDLGMIFQAYNLITSLSVLDNVALPQMFVSASRHKRNKWSMQLLERFGINQHAKKIPTELSGGQQQRIGIARSIVNNPALVLADEPVGNLDSVSAKNVLDILSDLNEREKKTVIMVTHNPENLIYADRIFYLKDGTIIREVVNKDKNELKRQAQKTPTAEITDLMRAYHGLTPEQINILIMPYKARIFAHHFITTRSMEEAKTFEDAIQRRLMGTATVNELHDTLHRPSADGGVGFDIRSADKIMSKINNSLRMSYFVYQAHHQEKNAQGEHDPVTEDAKTAKLTDYLISTCYEEYADHLTDEQLTRLRKAVKDRITNVTQKNEFYTALDLPLKEGGVGLNSKTAKAMTEEIELVLILGFGVIQINPQDLDSSAENGDLSDKNDSEITSDESKDGSATDQKIMSKPLPLAEGSTIDKPAIDFKSQLEKSDQKLSGPATASVPDTSAPPQEPAANNKEVNDNDRTADEQEKPAPVATTPDYSIPEEKPVVADNNMKDDDRTAEEQEADNTNLQAAIQAAQEREERVKQGSQANKHNNDDIYF